MNRFMAIAVGGLLILGCHGSDGGDDDDDSSGLTPGPGGPPGSAGQTQFQEGFEAGFPASNWTLVSGSPVVVGDQGQAPPALLIGAMNEPVLFRTPFAFSSSSAFTLSFDLVIPAPKPGDARFEFRLMQEGAAATTMASAVVPETTDLMVMTLGNRSLQFPFASDGVFHKLTLQVLEDRTAIWFFDSGAIMTERDFPAGAFRIELFGHGNEMHAGMVVDNILLTRP